MWLLFLSYAPVVGVFLDSAPETKFGVYLERSKEAPLRGMQKRDRAARELCSRQVTNLSSGLNIRKMVGYAANPIGGSESEGFS